MLQKQVVSFTGLIAENHTLIGNIDQQVLDIIHIKERLVHILQQLVLYALRQTEIQLQTKIFSTAVVDGILCHNIKIIALQTGAAHIQSLFR